jgi:hypothetical protein
MSPLTDSNALLVSDVMDLLRASPELAAWDPSWSGGRKVFEGLTDGLSGARNLGRLPFVEVGYATAEREEVSTADYTGRLALRLRCRCRRQVGGTGDGVRAGEMLERIERTLADALHGGTVNCRTLRNGTAAVVSGPRAEADGRALVFDVALEWTAPAGRPV